jgi:hypothetical protein
METATADVGPKQTSVADAQPAGNASEPSAPVQTFQDLARRCEELGVVHRISPGIEDALNAIDAAKKTAHWKSVRREKLRQRIKRVIHEAEASSSALDVEPAGSSTMHAGQPRHSAMRRLTPGIVHSLSGRDTGAPPVTTPAASQAQPPPQPPTQPSPPQPLPPQQPPPQPSLPQPLLQPSSQLAQQDGGDGADELMTALQVMSDGEFDAFHAWRMANGEPELHLDAVHGWRNSPEYDQYELRRRLRAMSREESEAFCAWRVSHGLSLHLDTVDDWESSPEYDEFELQQRVERWTTAGMPGEPKVYTTTWAELLEHCGGPQKPGESDAQYQARVSQSLSQRAEPLPPPPPSRHLDGQTDDYYDGGAEDIWCMSCNEERPGERGLSRVECDASGEPARVFLRRCRRCDRGVDQL